MRRLPTLNSKDIKKAFIETLFATFQNLRNILYTVQTATMNVLVDMYILSTLAYWAGGLYISSVDFGCFSTVYGDCEALGKREEQVNFTLLLYIN